MKKIGVTIIVLLIIIVACITAYLFTPIGTGRNQLNSEQVDSLRAELSGKNDFVEEYYEKLPNTYQEAIKIFGVESHNDVKTVYGFVWDGYYIKIKDKAYCESGGSYEFMVDVKVDGNDVKIIKTYGDGVSSENTYAEMPWRYSFKISNYDPYKLKKEVEEKVEAVLGVPVDKKYMLGTDGENYEIYHMDAVGNFTMKEEGKFSDLYERRTSK